MTEKDKGIPIQKWWPNYPNPVQMYLCWERDDTYKLLCNEADVSRSFALNPGVSGEHLLQGESGKEVGKGNGKKRPPPSYEETVSKKMVCDSKAEASSSVAENLAFDNNWKYTGNIPFPQSKEIFGENLEIPKITDESELFKIDIIPRKEEHESALEISSENLALDNNLPFSKSKEILFKTLKDPEIIINEGSQVSKINIISDIRIVEPKTGAQNNPGTCQDKNPQTPTQTPTAPIQLNSVTGSISNDKDPQDSKTKNKKMRPYKKRLFHSHLQSTENNMETENSEDSEKQVSSSPPIEDIEKEKDKDGETKRRKRWKRKISRKQFRHHDIKLFTPGEYRTSTFLKHKDSSNAVIPKKPVPVSKESITDLIVTSLGGVKHTATQKKLPLEEIADDTAKKDTEENNNSNGVQNNNNVGKHHLPAIIMETPSTVRRRSIDNTIVPKNNFRATDTLNIPKKPCNRRMSVDMPLLNQLSDKNGTEKQEKQFQVSDKSQETIVRNNGSKTDNESPRYATPDAALLHSYPQEFSNTSIDIQQNSRPEEQVHELTLSNQISQPLDARAEPNEEPENLSLKRRYSVESPVDLSNKNYHRDNNQHQISIETNRTDDNLYSPTNSQHSHIIHENAYREEYARNNNTAQSTRASPTIRNPKDYESNHSEQSTANTDTLVKITNLKMWKELLQRLLKQTFTLQVLDLMAHVYDQIDKVKGEACIPPDMKQEAQNLLLDTYRFIADKLHGLNLDISPDFVIKILGQAENTSEKNTLQNYIENIQRIRELALDDTLTAPHHLRDNKKMSWSTTSPYLSNLNQSPIHRNSGDHHLSREPSPKNSDHFMRSPKEHTTKTGSHHVFSRCSSSSPVGHIKGPSLRPGYFSFEHFRGQSPRTAEQLLHMSHLSGEKYSQVHSRGPSPRTEEYTLSQGVLPTISHNILVEHHIGAFSVPRENSRQNSRGPSPRFSPNGSSPRFGEPFSPIGYPGEPHGIFSKTYMESPSKDVNTYSLSMHKEPLMISPAPLARPRSKSHRHMENKIRNQHSLKRSISNPQDNSPTTHPYLEGDLNRMHPPKVPTHRHDMFPCMQPPRPQRQQAQQKEMSIASTLSSTPSKTTVPQLYSEAFYQNLHNHVAKGNPLAISVHPYPKYCNKTSSNVPVSNQIINGRNERNMASLRDLPPKIQETPHVQRTTRVPTTSSPVEDKISSSTDNLEISKIAKDSTNATFEKVPIRNAVPQKHPELLKGIPAVIVADKSMQITKESTVRPADGQDTPSPIEVIDKSDARTSVSSSGNISSSEENLRQAFDKEQDENNTEFLVWLEKLKSNEKLKSKFLSQMGIIKKEEKIFMPGSDPIEIVDSDEENSSQIPGTKESSTKSGKEPKTNEVPTSSQETGGVQPGQICTNKPIPPQPTAVSCSLEINRTSSTPVHSQRNQRTTPKESLSKKDYIPPIPLPYVPSSTVQSTSYSSSPKPQSKKVIYSPEIEPISPVGAETSFVFPEVPNVAKVITPVPAGPGERPLSYPENVTSPTNAKRKNPMEYPAYRNEEIVSPNTVKRRKSLDRPQVSKSPRVAPSGKLCYVRENHMFLRYFDDTQVELFIRNLSTQDEELFRSTGLEPEQFKKRQPSKYAAELLPKTEVIHLPRGVEFSGKEDIPEVEEFIKETDLVERYVPKDFADFYRYVTGFQIIKNKHPVSLQTFLTMYNTNRTSELLRKYLERLDEGSSRVMR